MNDQYPRTPGSDTHVAWKDWKQEAPFGQCPACGSAAIEELSNPHDPEICFYCSDTTCRDLNDRRTVWAETKTAELRMLESQGKSWNQFHFPGQTFPEACPD